MSRQSEYKFVDTDSKELISRLTAAYEKRTKHTIHPADPEMLFISWIASVIIQERAVQNYIGNQNIPSRAEDENLDALGELLYNVKREEAQKARCIIRFFISAVQKTPILIPSGTRVTDTSRSLVWGTLRDVYIAAGETYADAAAECEKSGTIGNGYMPGQINTLVDVDNILYYTECRNIDISDGGAEQSNDDEYYSLMRAGMDAFSCAGPKGAYIYHAKKVSRHIADVVPIRPSPGCVDIYILMDDGTAASDEIKNKVLAECNADDVRPLTDFVSAKDPEEITYDIEIKYFVPSDSLKSSVAIRNDIEAAVAQYVKWQSGKLGRDINPSYLLALLMTTGIKRAELSNPPFQKLKDGSTNTSTDIPQIAKVGRIVITDGGFEDD